MKKALVLSGGGAKGGYEIGVWKALKEIGYTPDIITGTSVGALNGALFTIGEDKLAEEIWENMSMDTVFEQREDKDINAITSVQDFLFNIGKIVEINPTPLKDLVNKLLDDKNFKNSKIEFGIVATKLKKMQKVEKFANEMQDGNVVDYVLASSACFPVMARYTINGEEYIDGGYSDNLPFQMAMKKGAEELVIVDLPSLFKPKKMEDINAVVHYIKPKHDLGNFIIFNKENSINNIKLGYLDTMKVFGRLEGNFYSFKKGAILKANNYNKTCKSIYKRIFTGLPMAGGLEKLAEDRVLKYLRKYEQEIFTQHSNFLDILEISASCYSISFLNEYDFDGLSKKIIEKYRESIDTKEYLEILSLSKIKKSLNNVDELKKIIKMYDSTNIIAYIVNLLEMPQLTIYQRGQIQAISMLKPEYFLSAVFIAAYRR